MLRFCAAFVLIFLPHLALAELSGIVTVIDADTWDVGEERVRLFGIDAPELDQTCTDNRQVGWDCGVWATDQTRTRFDGHIVICERLETDRYGRTVARCFDKGSDVARDMVNEGLALAYRRYSFDYVHDENAAALGARGLHVGKVQPPAEFRAENRAVLRNARFRGMEPGCRIKGNISSAGEHIYHTPGQQFYQRTRISAARGERWFCSETEALSSGWRRSLK